MKKILILMLSLAAAAAGIAAPKAEKASIAITKVVATNALKKSLKSRSGTESLDRILESMNANLSSAFLATRKFDVISRSDIDAVISEQQFGESGNVDKATAPKIGKLKGAKYIVTVFVDDYQDFIRKREFASLNKSTQTRIIRYGAVANLIDATTGSIKESANFVISNEAHADRDADANISGGDLTDSAIAALARTMCRDIAFRISDIIYPAKVIGKSGKVVTFNRAKDTGVKVGDTYEVFAVGESMVDPDTGEDLGAEEILIGEIRVTSVLPKFSKGTVVGADNGIEKGQILRPKKSAEPAASASDKDEEL